MRKFWRIGAVLFAAVLLIGLSACGDKKAEQAKALQQEIQDLLARNGGNDKILTHGDITVTPDGDAFAVTIDKVVLAPPQIAPIDLGIIGFKLTTDGDDIQVFALAENCGVGGTVETPDEVRHLCEMGRRGGLRLASLFEADGRANPVAVGKSFQ